MTTTSRQPRQSAGLVFRPAAERFHSRLTWLESWHSFSFSHHHDPAWMGFGPLRVINDDTIAAGRGFGMHPHSDMEIITVMVDGELSHRDSMGNGAVLRAGEVQRMSAGTGIIHSEINAAPAPCRLLQIWIEPSRRGVTPAYEQRAYPISPEWTLLIDPDGRAGAMAIERPVRLWRACPQPGSSLALPLEAGQTGWIQLVEGDLELELPSLRPTAGQGPGASQRLERGDGLGFAASGTETLRATATGTDLLLFALA
jgi:redox-sensitive bicupin YhaK (pirin superfamily)